MGSAVPNPDGPMPPSRPRGKQQQMAEHLEKTFNKERQSLTDDKTAAAYTTTLTVVLGLLESARAQGLVDTAQHRHLAAMIDGIMGAPGLVV